MRSLPYLPTSMTPKDKLPRMLALLLVSRSEALSPLAGLVSDLYDGSMMLGRSQGGACNQ